MDGEKIISIIFFGSIALFGFIKWIMVNYKMKKYVKVTGKVVSTNKQPFFDSTDGNHCKYKFEFQNKIYDVEDNFFGGNPKLKVGDTVDVYVSEENSNKYLLPENIYFKKIYFLMFLFGILSIIVF